MKAAVMTWHTYDNFGSLLQAYALQRSLEKLGVESYLVNYDPESYNPNNCTRTSDWVKTHIRMTLKLSLIHIFGTESGSLAGAWASLPVGDALSAPQRPCVSVRRLQPPQ